MRGMGVKQAVSVTASGTAVTAGPGTWLEVTPADNEEALEAAVKTEMENTRTEAVGFTSELLNALNQRTENDPSFNLSRFFDDLIRQRKLASLKTPAQCFDVARTAALSLKKEELPDVAAISAEFAKVLSLAGRALTLMRSSPG